MERHLLSKSTFIRGHQCLKSLYLYKKRYFLRDPLPDEQRLKFRRGHEVGVLARQLFPGGIDLGPKAPSQYQKAVRNTTGAIESGSSIIYEAGFQYDRVLVFLDILYRNHGAWNACEVKSSRDISDTYLLDAALQYYVITNSGPDISIFYIAHIDEGYVREGSLDLSSLFKLVDVTDKIIPLQAYVKEQVEKEKAVLQLTSSPGIDVGPHCYDPYPCDFIGHCWKNIDKEVVSIEIISSEIKKAAGVVEGDISFLHVSSFRPAIPLYSGTHPYQEIPFQFSLINSRDQLVNYLLPPGEHPDVIYHELGAILKEMEVVVTDAGYRMPDTAWPGKVIQIREFFTNMELYEIANRVLGYDPFKDLKIKKSILAVEAYNKMLDNDPGEDYGRLITDFGNTSVQLVKKLYNHLVS